MIELKITSKTIFTTIIALSLFALLYSFTSNTASEKTNSPRTIEVIGSAEMSLKPDKIKLRIQLAFNNKTRKAKEDKLFKILKKHGIEEDKVEYANFNGYTGWYYNWYRYYYEYWYYNSRYYHTYDIPIDASINPKKLLQDLKKPDINGLWIQNDGFKDITAQRKKVKIAAIKAAKEKANYLLGAVDEKLGYVVSIKEVSPIPNSRFYNPYWGYGYGGYNNNLSSSSSNSIVNSNQNQQNTVKGAATDKLKYEVQVVFTIQ